MLCQAYDCMERTKHKLANQTTKKQMKNLTTVLTRIRIRRNKCSNNCFGEYENCEIEKLKCSVVVLVGMN